MLPEHPRAAPPDRPGVVCGGDGGVRQRRLHTHGLSAAAPCPTDQWPTSTRRAIPTNHRPSARPDTPSITLGTPPLHRTLRWRPERRMSFGVHSPGLGSGSGSHPSTIRITDRSSSAWRTRVEGRLIPSGQLSWVGTGWSESRGVSTPAHRWGPRSERCQAVSVWRLSARAAHPGIAIRGREQMEGTANLARCDSCSVSRAAASLAALLRRSD